jgi:hypothetical protein
VDVNTASRAASLAIFVGLANILIGATSIAEISTGGSFSAGMKGWVMVLGGAFGLAAGLLSLGFRETYAEGASVLGVAALVVVAAPYLVLVLF